MLLIIFILAACAGGCAQVHVEKAPFSDTPDVIKLPAPLHDSDTSVEEALLDRRSVREYRDEPITPGELSQLLWAAQGTAGRGRTAPSAGGLYPLEVYVAVGNVEDMAPGIYKYGPEGHELFRIADGDKRGELADAALGQASVKNGAADIVIAGVYERTTGKYGPPGVKYVHMEAGHASQNVYLQAASLGLGTVAIGAFYDEAVKKAVDMPAGEQPLYIMPVGRV